MYRYPKELPTPPKGRKFAEYYIVTEDGRIWSHFISGFLKPALHMKIEKYAYYQVWLKGPDGPRWFKVHRLVALLYCPNPDPSIYVEVNHKDRNKLHNHYTNLEWVTKSQNILHSYKKKDKDGNYRARPMHRLGQKLSEETKQLMSQKKTGIHHPQFIGFYSYEGQEYTSMNQLGITIGKSVTQVKRMLNKGLISFRPKSTELFLHNAAQMPEEPLDLSA